MGSLVSPEVLLAYAMHRHFRVLFGVINKKWGWCNAKMLLDAKEKQKKIGRNENNCFMKTPRFPIETVYGDSKSEGVM